jgi:hypothetical protein
MELGSDPKQIAKHIKMQFGMVAEVDTVIARDIDVSRAVKATVVLTKKKQLLCYVYGHSKLTLSDVQKIIARMGLRAELYMPPKGQPNYFDEVGKNLFCEVFPGRTPASEYDIQFYRTLAPYNPALALISEVKDGHIYQFDSDSRSKWRVAAKFAYRRIKTS